MTLSGSAAQDEHCPASLFNLIHHGRATRKEGAVLVRDAMAEYSFDPIAVVIDWFDACRARRLNDLLNLYDGAATLECGCDGPRTYRGRSDLEYALSKPRRTHSHSTNLLPDTDGQGVVLEYLSNEGKPVRIHFEFTDGGKIVQTVCGPVRQGAKAA
jgi:hypothetical protein